MDPINYLAAVPQEDFLRDIQGGFQLGQAYRQAQQLQQQQQLAQQQAQQYQADVQAAMANPTPQAFSALALKYPAQREAIKQSWDGLSAGDQKTEGDTMAQAYSALLAGKPDVAKQVVQAQIDARKNSGLDTSHYDNALALLDSDPKQAQGALGFALSHITDPKTFAQTFGSLQGEQRTADAAPADLTKKQADAAGAAAGVVGQTLGSLQGKNAKPAQAITAIKSLQARGLLSADDAQALQDSIPTDPKALDDWFGQQRAAGMKADEQQKYATPDANAQLSAQTSRYATDSAARTAGARLAFDKEQAAAGDDVSNFTPEAIDNAAKRYNLDGTLPPMGMGAAASAGRTKILNRAAELAAGVDGTDQRQNQLNVKNQQRAMQDFTSGKLGSSVRSFNVGISHLDTLGNLADALGNKDTQAVNRIGNYFATQTGNPAPTNFNAAKKIVGDEIVKAIVGAGGGVHDREEAAKVIDAANSPAQLKGAINTYKELMIGQLGGLEKQYNASTGRTDFERFLSPQAQTLRRLHSPAASAASAGPTVGTVEGGYRFKGGDPSKPANWEKL